MMRHTYIFVLSSSAATITLVKTWTLEKIFKEKLPGEAQDYHPVNLSISGSPLPRCIKVVPQQKELQPSSSARRSAAFSGLPRISVLSTTQEECCFSAQGVQLVSDPASTGTVQDNSKLLAIHEQLSQDSPPHPHHYLKRNI